RIGVPLYRLASIATFLYELHVRILSDWEHFLNVVYVPDFPPHPVSRAIEVVRHGLLIQPHVEVVEVHVCDIVHLGDLLFLIDHLFLALLFLDTFKETSIMLELAMERAANEPATFSTVENRELELAQ